MWCSLCGKRVHPNLLWRPPLYSIQVVFRADLAALVARIIQMFTHRCSRVSVCCVFFVSCPQASARFPNVHFERGQDIGQGRPGVQEENQGRHQNTLREAWTEQGHRPGHPSCHPPTGVTWSRRVMWHQRPLVTIPWRSQRESAENSGTFFQYYWLCV